jgi:hypothetical protein
MPDRLSIRHVHKFKEVIGMRGPRLEMVDRLVPVEESSMQCLGQVFDAKTGECMRPVP